MSKEALLAVQPAAWAAIAPAEGVAKDIWHYTYRNAVWLNQAPLAGGFEKCNVPGNQAQIQALIDQLNPVDIKWAYAWDRSNGYDSLDFLPTDPATLIADVGPNPSDIGHSFAGQTKKIYAGGFSNGFSSGFR